MKVVPNDFINRWCVTFLPDVQDLDAPPFKPAQAAPVVGTSKALKTSAEILPLGIAFCKIILQELTLKMGPVGSSY